MAPARRSVWARKPASGGKRAATSARRARHAAFRLARAFGSGSRPTTPVRALGAASAAKADAAWRPVVVGGSRTSLARREACGETERAVGRRRERAKGRDGRGALAEGAHGRFRAAAAAAAAILRRNGVRVSRRAPRTVDNRGSGRRRPRQARLSPEARQTQRPAQHRSETGGARRCAGLGNGGGLAVLFVLARPAASHDPVSPTLPEAAAAAATRARRSAATSASIARALASISSDDMVKRASEEGSGGAVGEGDVEGEKVDGEEGAAGGGGEGSTAAIAGGRAAGVEELDVIGSAAASIVVSISFAPPLAASPPLDAFIALLARAIAGKRSSLVSTGGRGGGRSGGRKGGARGKRG